MDLISKMACGRGEAAPASAFVAQDGGTSPIAVQAPAGHMMCLAHVGALVSVVRITVAICGSADGCHGSWRCMTGENGDLPPAGSARLPTDNAN